MKKYLVAGCALFLLACQRNENNVHLKGTLYHLPVNEVYLIRSGDAEMIDTIKVKEGQFEYQTRVNEPTVFMINFGPERAPGFMILEEGETTLRYDASSGKGLEVNGGEQQKEYDRFLTLCQPYFLRMDSLGQVAGSFEKNIDSIAALHNRFQQLDAELKEKQFQFITRETHGVAAAFLASNYLNDMDVKSLPKLNALYHSLHEKTRNTYYGRQLQKMKESLSALQPGKMAPDFTLTDTSGKKHTLSDFRGQTVLLDFWASWCVPCRAENPNVLKAWNRYHAKGLNIVAVSLDKNRGDWLEAIQEDGLPWTQLSDLGGWNSSVVALYALESIPSNVLIDPNGHILATNLRGELLQEFLQKQFP
ncbi:MAG TPA: TlpA disulfide reductase family protein [Chitinophagaceae bacterium]|nr:TlpA disulfide reductase family protein [Chitinophagaceae bacterium]